MADDSKIKYSDLVSPDGSIESLIAQLEALNKQYSTMVNAIKSGAKEIVQAMKSTSTSTAESRAAIDEETAAANRLEKAQKELKFAISDVGKQVAWLKEQTKEANTSTVLQQKSIRELDSSYAKLKLGLKDATQLWQSLSEAERQDTTIGGLVLNHILDTKTKLKDLDNELKLHTTQLTEVQKAEERVNYLRSEEGQKLIALRKEIQELLRGEKEEKQAITDLEAAQQKLNYLRSEEGQKLIAVRKEISEAIRGKKEEKQEISQLEAAQQRLNYLRSAEGQKLIAVRQEISETLASKKQERQEVDLSVVAQQKLEAVQKELTIAMSETGRQIAQMKQKLKDTNAASAQQQQYTSTVATSYDRLTLELKENIQLWQSLSAAERQDAAMGGQVLQTIINLKNQIKELDNELKIEVAQMTEVQKAQERLNYLRSEEGQKLIALKKEISEVLRGEKEEKQTIDQLTVAQQKLAQAKSEYNRQLISINNQIREANRIAKLTVQVNNSATGSYNQLAAQYQLNKIKLNAMSQEERRAVDVGQKLEAETLRIYKQMIMLQEATGNHTLSVGNYAKAWNGLGNATNQIVRELPAATMGLNTFFLAISNNVPILIDEIQRVRDKNKLLRAEGQPTQNVMKTITSALFGWQTALILVMTTMSMYGKQIYAFIKQIYSGVAPLKSQTELLRDVQAELEKTSGQYGDCIVSLKKLSQEWSHLSSKKEQLQWIKDNKSEFDKLGISINSVMDAENALVNHTDAVVNSLKFRAKAAAAMQLASKKYEEALQKQYKAEQEKKDPSTGETLKTVGSFALEYITSPSKWTSDAEKLSKEKFTTQTPVERLKSEAKAAEAEADALFNIADGYNAKSEAELKNAGIERKHKTTKTRTRKGREPRDLTDTINKNEISLQKKYEESITELQHDEYAKRRREAVESARAEIAELKEKYRKNEEYVANSQGKYKPLTEEQKKQIEKQQSWIVETITNARAKATYELGQIQKEQQVNSLKIMRETIDWQLDDIAKSIDNEKALKLEQLKDEEDLVKQTNATIESGGRSQAEITAEYEKKRVQLIAQFDQQILALRQADVNAQLEVVKKGSQEQLDLQLQQNELARKLALSQNAAKPATEQQSETQINQSYDRKAQNITASFTMTGFDEAQAQALATFNVVKHSQIKITKFTLQQERDRWVKQLELAKSGALNWSDAQIQTAEDTIKKLEREIKEASNFMNVVGDKGLGGALLSALGFDDGSISKIESGVNTIIGFLEEIAQAEVDLAQQAVDAAEERVSAAQSAYDAEIEARANGYANNVATAKKELQQEKKNQQEKQKLLEEAQRRQEAIQTTMQAVSLITASAQLWSSFSGIPIVGPALALAAIATMWTSFAVAKAKAAQVTAASSNQEYGEGGLEFLEGGSHASGNDIDLKTKNEKGKNMRAEGGEALAIINKRSTRRYRKQLPGIIKALNKGTFEEKYLRAFEHGETLHAQIVSNQTNVDLSKVVQLIDDIKKQNSQRAITFSDGTTAVIKKNVTRYYK